MKIEEKKGGFVITDFNELEAYKIACKIEKDGIDFYAGILYNEKNEATKKEFGLLVEEEKEHLKYFESCLFETRQKVEDGFEEDDVLNYIDYGIFQPFQSIADLESKIAEAREALHLAIFIEDNSIKFYKACREEVSSLETKKELNNIIEEEKRHKRRFEDMFSRL